MNGRDLVIFFFNDTATTEIYTLSLHDALPISATWPRAAAGSATAASATWCQAAPLSPKRPVSAASCPPERGCSPSRRPRRCWRESRRSTNSGYERHARAACILAEEHFDSDKVLTRLLELVGSTT